MSLLDETIRLGGMPMTIIRTGGNISSYFSLGTMSRRGLDPLKSYERHYLIPTDSGVVEGDLIQDGSDYYLVASLSREESFGEFHCYQGTLYRCNSVVTVRKFDSNTGAFADFKTGVRCLITRVSRNFTEDDRARTMADRAGMGNLFEVFAQESVGIDKGCVLADQSNRKFRVSNDPNPTIASGLSVFDVMLEV